MIFDYYASKCGGNIRALIYVRVFHRTWGPQKNTDQSRNFNEEQFSKHPRIDGSAGHSFGSAARWSIKDSLHSSQKQPTLDIGDRTQAPKQNEIATVSREGFQVTGKSACCT